MTQPKGVRKGFRGGRYKPRRKYKLLVASVCDPVWAVLPKTTAVTAILEYHGFEYRQVVDMQWEGWSSKLTGFIDIVRTIDPAEGITHIMFIDAADVVLLDGPDEVMRRYFAFDHPWVYNAEPHIWSPGSFQPEDYPTPRCIYRYLNAGASIGEVDHILKYFAKWTKDGPPVSVKGDQDWFAARFIEEYPDAIKLDHRCELFQCMCGSLIPPDPHCTVVPGKVYNNRTMTEPIIIHFNGGDDITKPERRLLWGHWI